MTDRVPEISIDHLLRVGQVWEKINGPGFHWESELGELVVITRIDIEEVHYRRVMCFDEYHSHAVRRIDLFEGRFKLVVDV